MLVESMVQRAVYDKNRFPAVSSYYNFSTLPVRMEMNAEKTVVLRISRQPSQMKIMIDQKQPESVEYCNYFGSITNDAKCTCEIKSRIAVAKATFNKKKSLLPTDWT
jgi:hypothetical protein